MKFYFKKLAIISSETSPPESSVLKIEALNGFKNESKAIEKLKEAVKKSGLKMNWDKPDVTHSGSEQTKTYWDLEEGTNGRLFLTYKDSKLVSIGYGMAL